MAKLVPDELKQECHKHLRESACTKRDGDEWKFQPVCGTSLDEIGKMTRSVGVVLYFDYMKWVGIVFLGIFVLSCPMLAFNLRGTMVESPVALEKGLGMTTIANIGRCPYSGCRSAEQLEERCAWEAGCHSEEEPVRVKDVTQWLGLLDGLAILVFMGFHALYLLRRIPSIADAVDRASLTPSDYTVDVTVCPRFLGEANAPGHKEYKPKLKQHFLNILKNLADGAVPDADETAIPKITLVREFNGAVKSFMSEGALRKYKDNAEALAKMHRELKQEKKAEKHEKQVKALDGQIGDLQAARGEEAKKNALDRAVVRAFVTFNKIEYKDKVLNEYRFSTNRLFWLCQSTKLRFEGYRIVVKKAPEPTDLTWENIDYDPCARYARRACICLSTWLVLMICAALLVSIKTSTVAVPTIAYNTWILKNVPPLSAPLEPNQTGKCFGLCELGMYSSALCDGAGSGNWAMTSVFDSTTNHSVASNATWRTGSEATCVNTVDTPQCSGGAGDWLGITFAQPQSVRCMLLTQKKGEAVRYLQPYGCPGEIPAAADRAGWSPEENCVPMQMVQAGVVAEQPWHTGVSSGRMQVSLSTTCTMNISISAGALAVERGDSFTEECFCKEQLALNPNLVTPPYDTEVKQICERWSLNNAKKYGMLVAGILAVVILNQVLLQIFTLFIDFERLGTVTEYTMSQMTKLFLAQFINTGLLIYFVNAKFGSSVPGIIKVITEPLSIGRGSYYEANASWFIAVGTSFFVTLVSQVVSTTITPIIMAKVVVPLVRRWALWSGSTVTKELLFDLFQYPEWNLSLRVAQSMNIICCVVFYAAGMPILYAVGALYCLAAYWMDKYLLLRCSKRPPAYSKDVMQMTALLTPAAALLHTLFACSVLGNPTLFPSDWSVLRPLAEGVFGISLAEYEEIMARWSTASDEEQNELWNDYLQARFLDFSRNGCWLLLLLFLFCCAIFIIFCLYRYALEPVLGPIVSFCVFRCRKLCGLKTKQVGDDPESDMTYEEFVKQYGGGELAMNYMMASNAKYRRAAEVIAKPEDSSASPSGSVFATVLGFFGLGKKSEAASTAASTPQADPEAPTPEAKAEAPAPGDKAEAKPEATPEAKPEAMPEATPDAEAEAEPQVLTDKA